MEAAENANPDIELSSRERLSTSLRVSDFSSLVRLRLCSRVLELDSRFSSSFFPSVTDKTELLSRVGARNYGDGNSGLSIAV